MAKMGRGVCNSRLESGLGLEKKKRLCLGSVLFSAELETYTYVMNPLAMKPPLLGLISLCADIVELHADRTEDGKLCCRLCRHLTHKTYNMRLHLEGKHAGLSAGYICDLCHAVFKTKHLLRHHRLKCMQQNLYQ